MAAERIFRRARVDEAGPLVDLAVEGDRFLALGPNLPLRAPEEVDLGGRCVLPGLVESHIHLDKAFLEEREPNLSGTLGDAIRITAKLKAGFTRHDIRERAERVLRMALRHGTLFLRTHVEVDPIIKLQGMEAILELREAYRGLLDIQIVVFPQEGIEQQPGTYELMREALRMGGDAVGGVPYNDLDARRHVDLVFSLAQEFGAAADLHVDFSDNPADRTIEYIAQKTVALGYQGRVSAGHLTALGSIPGEEAKRLIGRIAAADIHIIPLPATDLHLGGRGDRVAVRRGLTRIRELLKAGANVAFASNNIRNAFTPTGNADLMEVGLLLACAAHMSTPEERRTVLRMCTGNAARLMGLGADYGLQEGRRADFVAFDSSDYGSLLLDQPEKRYVVKGGRVVVENRLENLWRAPLPGG
ncbi:MAG: amidohydrolase family protein [Nitrospinota bacterium]